MIVGAAALLFVASAVGLLGTWALGVGLAVIVASSVVTAIVWEEREALPRARVTVTNEPRDELVPAQTP
jgi:hypothetical protein